MFERCKVKQHHRYRHAAAGLELSIVEQQASLPEPSLTSSKPLPTGPSSKPPEVSPSSKPPAASTSSKPPGSTGSKPPGDNDYGAVLSALEQEDAESNQAKIPTQLELNKAYQPSVRLINVRTLPNDYLSLLLLKNGVIKTPWFTVEGMETEMDKVGGETEASVEETGREEDMDAQTSMEV